MYGTVPILFYFLLFPNGLSTKLPLRSIFESHIYFTFTLFYFPIKCYFEEKNKMVPLVITNDTLIYCKNKT